MPKPTLIEELAATVLRLERDLNDLREQLASEVRTNRLVVVDDLGREVIVAETLALKGVRLAVHDRDNDNAAMIYAEPSEEMCGFSITQQGDETGHWYEQAGLNAERTMRFWLSSGAEGHDTSSVTEVELQALVGSASVNVRSGCEMAADRADIATAALVASHAEWDVPGAELRINGEQVDLPVLAEAST